MRDEVSAAQERLKLSEAKRHEVLLFVCTLLLCALNFSSCVFVGLPFSVK